MSGIRGEYERDGVRGYYAGRGHSYRNPHEPLVRQAVVELSRDHGLDLSCVLDLACGSGEVTLAVRELGGVAHGIDPYTGEAYLARTGQGCEAVTFEQIEAGALRGRRYSLVACSFALHLVTESRLPSVCGALREVSEALLVIAPHKKPVVRREWGWELVEERVFSGGEPEWMKCRGRVCRGV